MKMKSPNPTLRNGRRGLLKLGGASVASLGLPAVHAQDADAFPSRPIRLVLPAAAGGTADAVSRIVADPLGKVLGQNVVVDNRPGAAGIVGTELAMNAPPDGHTLLVGTAGAMVVNPSLYRKLPYDPVKSFEPVVTLAFSPLVLVANPSLPVRNLNELVALLKSRPGAFAYASAGSGSTPHLAGELFRMKAEVDMLHVPYKGSTPGVTAVMANEVSFIFSGISSVLGQIKTGKLRAIAVTAAKRSPALPDVPLVSESLPGFVADFWYGLYAPAGTRPRVIASLNAAFNRIVNDPAVKERLLAQGSESAGGSPEQLASLTREDMQRWADVVKAANMKVE
jgi:tripartite-type tricarboxylate transporter receptor subunit TctC